MAESSSSTARVSSYCGSGNGIAGKLKLGVYKVISDSCPSEMDYEGEDVMYFCGLKSPWRCSWTASNPGRRFYGCQIYPVEPCRFLRWHDERFSARAVELINELRVREKFLYEEVTNRVNAGRERNCNLLEEFVIGENERLRGELEEMKKAFVRGSGSQCFGLNCILVLLVFALLGYVFMNK